MDKLCRTVPCSSCRPAPALESPAPRPRRHGTERAARAVAARFSRRAPLDWTALDYSGGADVPPTSNPPRFGVGFLLSAARTAQEGILAPFWPGSGGKSPLVIPWRSGASGAVLKRKVEGVLSSPFPSPVSFGSAVAVLARGRRPFQFLPGDRLRVFGDRVAALPRGRWRWWASGEGLGGGYCTPPNRT